MARRSHRVAPRKVSRQHLNQTKLSAGHRPPPPFSLDFSEMHPCSSELGLQQTELSGSLRIPLDLPCSLIVHLPVGYLADVSLTWVGGGSGLEDLREGRREMGDMWKGGEEEEYVEEGSKCEEWVVLEESGLPGSTERWEVSFLGVLLFLERHFLSGQVNILTCAHANPKIVSSRKYFLEDTASHQ